MGASLLPSVSVAACSGASGDVFLASWLWMVVMGVVTVVTGVVAQTCPLDALRPPFHLRGLLLALLPPSMRVPAQLLPAVRWGRREHNGHPLLASVLGIWPGGCGWQGKTASCGLGSVHLHRALWGISQLSGPELPMDRVETDPFLVLREQPLGPHQARGVVRAGGAAQSITSVCVRASGPSRLSRDLSAPWRSPWIVDGLSTVSVACLNKTLFMDTEVGISYHSTCHKRLLSFNFGTTEKHDHHSRFTGDTKTDSAQTRASARLPSVALCHCWQTLSPLAMGGASPEPGP